MRTIYPFIKWFFIVLIGLAIAVFSFGYWFFGLIGADTPQEVLKNTRPEDLTYLTQKTTPPRGKILIVVTSSGLMGSSGKRTGYELTELSRPYYVFSANGFEVDIASTQGGNPPVVIDKDDMGAFDHAFLNDSIAKFKVSHSLPIFEVNAADYVAVFFVGGKGAMFDFPENKAIQSIVRQYHEEGKVIGAVCHGPAALVNVTLENGRHFLENKSLSAFTNEEELFLIPEANAVFPFLLEDQLINKGASFKGGAKYLKNVVVDGNLVTGQNPWSTWEVAESVVRQLGFAPANRSVTGEEKSIEILLAYESGGMAIAKEKTLELLSDKTNPINRSLLAMHSIVAAMQWEMGRAIDLVNLLRLINNHPSENYPITLALEQRYLCVLFIHPNTSLSFKIFKIIDLLIGYFDHR